MKTITVFGTELQLETIRVDLTGIGDGWAATATAVLDDESVLYSHTASSPRATLEDASQVLALEAVAAVNSWIRQHRAEAIDDQQIAMTLATALPGTSVHLIGIGVGSGRRIEGYLRDLVPSNAIDTSRAHGARTPIKLDRGTALHVMSAHDAVTRGRLRALRPGDIIVTHPRESDAKLLAEIEGATATGNVRHAIFMDSTRG